MLKQASMILALTLLSSAGFADKLSSKDKRHEKHDWSIEATHGAMVAEVSDNSAIIWSRAEQEAVMHVIAYARGSKQYETAMALAENDFTAQVSLKGLKAETEYKYKVWFTSPDFRWSKPLAVEGEFTTAPKARKAEAVKFTWTGDFSGQNVCRDAEEGFPIFSAINTEDSDFFIGLGDMIYADNLCEEVGRYGNTQIPGEFIQSADLDNFWAHWRYNRADQGFQTLLQSTPYYGIWDDHEVVNDFGPLHDTRDTAPYTPGEKLMPMGLKAFLNYVPMPKHEATPHRLYRTVRWGKHLELFFLDNRQYRDANLAADALTRPKTMLGREQLTWLKDKIKQSDATWKVIVSSVPMAIPTGSPIDLGRDGWTNFDDNDAPTIEGIPQNATGFEYELVDILRTLRDEDANAVFITTDVHFAEVFRFTPFADSPDFQVHEVVIGPGNAGIFPNRDFDASLGTESLFFYGPESANLSNWEEAKTWFNYGQIEISRNGELEFSVKTMDAQSQFSLSLSPN